MKLNDRQKQFILGHLDSLNDGTNQSVIESVKAEINMGFSETSVAPDLSHDELKDLALIFLSRHERSLIPESEKFISHHQNLPTHHS